MLATKLFRAKLPKDKVKQQMRVLRETVKIKGGKSFSLSLANEKIYSVGVLKQKEEEDSLSLSLRTITFSN